MILDIDQLNLAVNILNQGGIIAYPTEAVWGLGCIPWNKEAVYRLLDIKSRPVDKGMILVGMSEEQFQPILEPLQENLREKIARTWPGPHTWVVPDPKDWSPSWIRGNHNSLAIRVSDHPVVRYLCAAVGTPLVSTSANKAGEAPFTEQQPVELAFLNLVDFIAPGDTGTAKAPSQIQDLITGEMIRAGEV